MRSGVFPHRLDPTDHLGHSTAISSGGNASCGTLCLAQGKFGAKRAWRHNLQAKAAAEFATWVAGQTLSRHLDSEASTHQRRELQRWERGLPQYLPSYATHRRLTCVVPQLECHVGRWHRLEKAWRPPALVPTQADEPRSFHFPIFLHVICLHCRANSAMWRATQSTFFKSEATI